MPIIENKQQLFYSLKKETKVAIPEIHSTQDAIEILKVSENGIFMVGANEYSKVYAMNDVNYKMMSETEQLSFFTDWCKTLTSFDVPFKITVFNKLRNMRLMREKVYYHAKNDKFDVIRDAYNDIIKRKVVDEQKGIEQKKYLTITAKKSSYEEVKSYFTTIETGITLSLQNVGCTIRPLNGTERIHLLYEFYRMGDENEYLFNLQDCISSGRDWKNDIVPGYISFENERIKLDNRVCCAMHIAPHSYGATISDRFFEELTCLKTCGIFSIDYIPIPKDFLIATLENKYMAIEDKITRQQQKHNKQKNFTSDITFKVRQEKIDIEEMLDDVKNNEQNGFWVSVSMMPISNDEEELSKQVVSIRQICSSNTCEAVPYKGQQREALNTLLPIGIRNVSEMRMMYTRMAASIIPFRVMELENHDRPFYYGTNMLSGNPILISRKKLVNANGFVFGKPGSGKSFTGAKMEVGSVYLTTSDSIIIVDPQNEYQDTVQMFDGTYLNLDAQTRTYINPFHCDLSELSTEKEKSALIKEKSSMMYSIAEHSMGGNVGFGTDAIIGRCVRKMYNGIASLPKEEQYIPTMATFFECVEKEVAEEKKKNNQIKAEAAEELSISMERFVDGTLNIFNHQTNVNDDNRVMAYGMRDLGSDLWGVSISIMLSAITKRLQKNFSQGIATWIYIDEFHYMTKTPFSKAYVVEAFKTFRKFGGIVTGLTQNVIDLLKDPDTTTLVSNSEYTMFMRQSPKDVEDIKTAFDNITEEQFKLVKNAAPGTGLVRFGGTTIPMDNRMDKTIPLYEIFNTNAHEKAVKTAKEERINGLA